MMKFVATTAAALALAVFGPEAAAQSGTQRKGEAQKERESPEQPQKPVTSEAEARKIAEKAAHFERVYRERAARIDRLKQIYREKGAETKLAELKEMRERLDKRHENAMQGFRRQLGEGRWAKVEKHMGGPSARALEVRNERANENAAERDARKAQKEAEGKQEKPPKEKERKDKPKDF